MIVDLDKTYFQINKKTQDTLHLVLPSNATGDTIQEELTEDFQESGHDLVYISLRHDRNNLPQTINEVQAIIEREGHPSVSIFGYSHGGFLMRELVDQLSRTRPDIEIKGLATIVAPFSRQDLQPHLYWFSRTLPALTTLAAQGVIAKTEIGQAFAAHKGLLQRVEDYWKYQPFPIRPLDPKIPVFAVAQDGPSLPDTLVKNQKAALKAFLSGDQALFMLFRGAGLRVQMPGRPKPETNYFGAHLPRIEDLSFQAADLHHFMTTQDLDPKHYHHGRLAIAYQGDRSRVFSGLSSVR